MVWNALGYCLIDIAETLSYTGGESFFIFFYTFITYADMELLGVPFLGGRKNRGCRDAACATITCARDWS